MKLRAMRFPWRGIWVPHGLLDVIRGCNLTCRACYNQLPPAIKPMAQVREDLAVLRQHRHLDAVSIIGGEPTLHPQLDQIIALAKTAGLKVVLFTNGLLLDEPRLTALRAAGLDAVFLHIDPHQHRPDLPSSTPDAVRELRKVRAAAIVNAGMQAGLSITLYPDALTDLDELVEFLFNSPHVDQALVTPWRDMAAMGSLTGCLTAGLRCHSTGRSTQVFPSPINAGFTLEYLQRQYDLSPFAFVGSNRDPDDPRWLSYQVASFVQPERPAKWAGIRASAAERLFLALYRRLKGRYLFLPEQSPWQTRIQLFINALSGGRARSNLVMLARSVTRRGTLRTKRLVLQFSAELTPDGSLLHCDHCPDATVRQGRLVPVCVVDKVVDEDQRYASQLNTPSTAPR